MWVIRNIAIVLGKNHTWSELKRNVLSNLEIMMNTHAI